MAARGGGAARGAAMSLEKIDAEEFSQSLEQIGEGWFRQLALGIKLGAPEALGLTRRQWADRIGLKVRDRAERINIGIELAAEGLSNRAIADVIGVDESTVRADKTAGNPAPNCAGQDGQADAAAGNPAPYTFINVESPAVKALSPKGRLELDAAFDELCWIEAFLECGLEWMKEDTWDELDGWGGLFEISKRFKKVAATFCRLFPGNARFAETLKYVVKSCALAAQETAWLARERAPEGSSP
jgi:hypothetical protein